MVNLLVVNSDLHLRDRVDAGRRSSRVHRVRVGRVVDWTGDIERQRGSTQERPTGPIVSNNDSRIIYAESAARQALLLRHLLRSTASEKAKLSSEEASSHPLPMTRVTL